MRDHDTMILFEGNIAAGKSTIGRRLDESEWFAFIEEPVGAWQKEFAGNLLEMFYGDPKRWSFTFQLAAFTTRAKTWTEILKLTEHSNVVLERSIYCDRYVFAKNCYESGLMSKTEWQLYQKLWDWLESNWCTPPDHIVYLRTPAKVCHERIRERGRSEEDAIPLDYLQSLERLHDEWLLDHPQAIVVDGTQQWSAEAVRDVLLEHGVELGPREAVAT
ncbi:MAG: deoxynucleoside kinase [Candidatus Bipolaricaulota bacterium]|nr:MAG: deoxynucleoside kinase [Candidatus Bipolaricaulota bacterium]